MVHPVLANHVPTYYYVPRGRITNQALTTSIGVCTSVFSNPLAGSAHWQIFVDLSLVLAQSRRKLDSFVLNQFLGQGVDPTTLFTLL